jgi:hypothetical protein
MSTVDISEAPFPDLDKSVSKRNLRWRANVPPECCKITSWSSVQCAIASEDKSSLAVLVRDGKMSAIHISYAPLPNLNESVTEGDALWGANLSRFPRREISSRTSVQCAITPIDLCCLSILVGHGCVIAIDVCKAPIPKLDESITELHFAASTFLRWSNHLRCLAILWAGDVDDKVWIPQNAGRLSKRLPIILVSG